MKRTNASLAMFSSLLLATTGAIFVPGCQPVQPSVGGPAPPTKELKTQEGKQAEQLVALAPGQSSGEANPLAQNPVLKAGDWCQWGGNSLRNNVLIVDRAPTEFAPGSFNRKTGVWDKTKAKNIKWVATLGSQTYGNTIVASGKVFLGTNNSNGYLKRCPSEIDLGCLLAFDETNGQFLWQHSSEKLPTGRVHDWPLMGICSPPLVEGNRLWFVTSRGEVKCLDAEGYYDGEDDGPVTREPARLFDVVRAEWAEDDKLGPMLVELERGKLSAELREKFTAAGAEIESTDAEIKLPAIKFPAVKFDDMAKGLPQKLNFKAKSRGIEREFHLKLAGPRLSAFRITTPDDKQEADTIWSFDMMKSLGTSQHNMANCAVTSWGDLLFVNSSNGVDESHLVVSAPSAPSFICMDKNTGEVYWTDNSPGNFILHGQWSSPAVAVLGGVPQVLFGGGDAWLYSFRADKGKDGKPELLWKFDCNPKDSVQELGGRGTRNDIISIPVIYDNKVYFGNGQDPEHGEGLGIFWCLDPTRRGDISEKIVRNRDPQKNPVPRRRIQIAILEQGDVIEDNPNSGVIWKYTEFDNDGDGEIDDYLEKFHRTISSPAIKNDLVFMPDFSGLFHCLDAQTGKVYWTYDMLAAMWASPMIAGDKVYIGDEDGDIAIFNVTKERHDPLAEINMLNSVYSTPIIANGVMYISNKDHVFAIQEPVGGAEK